MALEAKQLCNVFIPSMLAQAAVTKAECLRCQLLQSCMVLATQAFPSLALD